MLVTLGAVAQNHLFYYGRQYYQLGDVSVHAENGTRPMVLEIVASSGFKDLGSISMSSV